MFLRKTRHNSPPLDTISEWLENLCNDLNMQRNAGHREEGFYHQAASDWDIWKNQNISMIEFQIPKRWSNSGDNSLSQLSNTNFIVNLLLSTCQKLHLSWYSVKFILL